ncbi:MAG: ABC transporter ATP-binding protein [Bacteroidota bacterium]
MPTTLKKILFILTHAERRKLWWLGVAVLVMGVLEVIGVASILPFMRLVADTDVIMRNEQLLNFVHSLGMYRSRDVIIAAGAGVILLVLLSNLFTIFATWYKLRVTWSIVHQLGRRLLAGYLHRPYPFFLEMPSSRATSYILSEVNSFSSGVVIPLVEIAGRLIVSFILFGLLLWVDPLIATVMFGTLGMAYLIIYLAQRRMLTRLGELRIAMNVERYRALREVFDGIKTVLAYNRQGFFYRHFSGASEKFTDLQPKYQTVVAAPRNVLEILAFTTIVAITIYLFLAASGDLRTVVPKLSLYAVAGYRLLPALQKAFKALGSFRHNLPIVDKFYETLRSMETADLAAPAPPTNRLPLQEALRLTDVNYRYPTADRPTLADVNLEIRAGETIAFVGTTGSGKTSLVDVILGLLPADAGQLHVDGTLLTAANYAAWRASVAYVPQDVFLFDDSVLHNVLLEHTGAAVDAKRVRTALELADIVDFVDSLPEGLNTRIGEKGVRLSGGQRQRLGLARALYTEPSVLVLDEATSALDNVTERGIIEALDNLPREVTTLVIAHRLSTVQHADRIYFLDEGRIVAQGTYTELIEQHNDFRAMAQLA